MARLRRACEWASSAASMAHDISNLVPAEMPVYTKPGTEETWAAVADGMRAATEIDQFLQS